MGDTENFVMIVAGIGLLFLFTSSTSADKKANEIVVYDDTGERVPMDIVDNARDDIQRYRNAILHARTVISNTINDFSKNPPYGHYPDRPPEEYATMLDAIDFAHRELDDANKRLPDDGEKLILSKDSTLLKFLDDVVNTQKDIQKLTIQS